MENPGSSIISALGGGSGVDFIALAGQLVPDGGGDFGIARGEAFGEETGIAGGGVHGVSLLFRSAKSGRRPIFFRSFQ